MKVLFNGEIVKGRKDPQHSVSLTDEILSRVEAITISIDHESAKAKCDLASRGAVAIDNCLGVLETPFHKITIEKV